MSGIVVFGGTVEGRLFAEAFQNTNLELHICVTTEYGASLLPESSNIKIHIGRMDADEMAEFFVRTRVECCLDATHPYAEVVSENIVKACRKEKLQYIRVLREEGKVWYDTRDGGISYKESMEEAVEFLKHTTGNILITTGSKDLEKYTAIAGYKDRCYARVLPTASVLEKCRQLGFEGRNLIGMQGPFTEELNYWMLKQINASYMVTKNSGREGGYQEKCEAALRAGVHTLVVGRRERGIQSGSSDEEKILALPEAIHWIKEKYGFPEKRKVYFIGMGPGSEEQLTAEAEKCLKNCDVIIGAGRVLELCRKYADKPHYVCYRRDEIAAFLREHPAYCRAAVVYSGDIGFYSGAKGMREYLKEYEVHPVSGISSVSYFLNKLSVPWDEVELVSCHGRQANLIPRIKYHRWVCALLGSRDAVKQICERLFEFHMEHIRLTVGERLSYPEENIVSGLPDMLRDYEVDPLSVVLLENPEPMERSVVSGIADEAFIRGNVPMTKQEIRILSLAKLELTKNSVLYDIGAGTGSVAVEAAMHCENGQVYAIEKNAEGIHLIQENKRRFQVENLVAIEGKAPDCLSDLPEPTHAFIGGSHGSLMDIIHAVRKKNKEVRFVINAVTIETAAQLEQIREAFPEYCDMEVIQVNVAKGKKLGAYHLMTAQNPVYIVSFGGRREKRDEK